MILRSLTKHVKDQNWFAVGLDFAIVVIGVFIGIQVANWNDSVAEREQTERLLKNLAGDLKLMRVQLVDQADTYFDAATELDGLLSTLEAQGKVESAQAAEMLEKAPRRRLPPVVPAGLSELLVAGRLDLLQSPFVP